MFQIRAIQQKDNLATAQIIRTVMTEFGAVGEGTSIHDPEVDAMFEHYKVDRSIFFVIEKEGKLFGCGGIAPLEGGTKEICELRKMYFMPALRGLGWGKKMMNQCIDSAKLFGYETMYLETLESMEAANSLYKKFGFERLDTTLGNTGHGGCDAYYVLKL